jgi:hypothetical protein
MPTSTRAAVVSDGLLAIWADVDEPYVLRYQQWHNCEHIPERVSIPGFLVGRRYRGRSPARMFFMFYETVDAGVLTSEAYLTALNRPTEWTRESLQHFRRPLRNVYRKLRERGQPPRLEAPYVIAHRFNSGGATGDDIATAEGWIDAVARSRPVLRARLYELDREASSVQTAERSIYRGEPGKQRYLALFECTRPDPWDADTWQEAERSLPAWQRPDRLADAERESYWAEYVLYAPAR